MQIAYSIIKDRTDFKGQSQIRYRVVSEDPMCSGNQRTTSSWTITGNLDYKNTLILGLTENRPSVILNR